MELEVNFLHRTVYDFLKLPDIDNMLGARIGPVFDPFERLLKACVLWLKQVTVSRVDDSFLEVLQFVRKALIYARQSNQLTRNSNLLALDELDRIVMHHWMSVPRIAEGVDQRSSGLHWADDRNHRPTNAKLTHDNFISLAVEYGLTEYVREKLKEDGQLIKTKAGRPLLHYLLGNGDCLEPEIEMAEALLQYGADPNVQFDGWTISAHAFKYAQKNNAAAAIWQEIHALMPVAKPVQRHHKNTRMAPLRFIFNPDRQESLNVPFETALVERPKNPMISHLDVIPQPQRHEKAAVVPQIVTRPQRQIEPDFRPLEDGRGYQESEKFAMIPWETRIEPQRQEKSTKSVQSCLRRKLRKTYDLNCNNHTCSQIWLCPHSVQSHTVHEAVGRMSASGV
jgi:hypothetical protein